MVAFLNSSFLKNLFSKSLLARTSSFITTSALIQLQSQKAYVQIMPDSPTFSLTTSLPQTTVW